MKSLTTTLAAVSLLFGASAFATENNNAEQLAAELIKQQNAQVSETVAKQVNQDIQFTLRAMQLPVVELNDSMLAKAEQGKVPSTAASNAKFAE
ncbi:hypothetical protein [Thalassotalea euphylliae]|uniref:Uncharacterized protein n=1 Tax=Thalassotalea euphylliae TaxID=1655234 RepID=A0A3E0UEK0_9GAMM|nr:hypothetical protein [Thalassotalea euphylliae]REL34252.1 hypothetical protein DXX92_02200 [Thalassotalea euphylliae]